MQKLTEHVYGVLTSNNFLNGYLIQNGDAFTVIDVGSDASFAQTILESIRGLGQFKAHIANIIITHAHADHFGGLKALQEQVNAPTYAHRVDALVIQGEQVAPYAAPNTLNLLDQFIASVMLGNLPPAPPARVDQVVDEGDKLDAVLPDAQVIHLPGHSYGQIGVWLPEEKTLIGGDVMMHTPLGLTMPIKAASPDWDAAKNAIHKAYDLQPKNLMLGHGSPIIGDATRKIEKLMKRLKI